VRAQIYSGATSLRFSACSLKATRLSVTLNVETPENNLKLGSEIRLSLSTGASLRFQVKEERRKRYYLCELWAMPELEKKISLGASPNQSLSQIAQSELGAILAGGIKRDYILNNFAFSGSLWALLSEIEELIESRAYLTEKGIAFDPVPTSLKVGSKLDTSFNTGDKSQFELENFNLLPCRVDGREARGLHYDFRDQIVSVWF
jgi:hypothetical protein